MTFEPQTPEEQRELNQAIRDTIEAFLVQEELIAVRQVRRQVRRKQYAASKAV